MTNVSEVDEKEFKLAESQEMGLKEESQPEEDRSLTSHAVGISLPDISESSLPTPMPGAMDLQANPFSNAATPTAYDSDSTISGVPRRTPPVQSQMDISNSSGIDIDIHPFVSKLPRRKDPVASVPENAVMVNLTRRIADVVRRFQESTAPYNDCPPQGIERPRSAASHRPQRQDLEGSDSGSSQPKRPKLRRGRTDQPMSRPRDVSKSLMSDGERSYAIGATRLPIPRRSVGRDTTHLTPTSSQNPSPRSGRNSPDPSMRADGSRLSNFADARKAPGKGRASRQGSSADHASSSVSRSATRRGLTMTTSRVSSIARHFDQLSKAAEISRTRLVDPREKRARPVGVARARVQVFRNVRDAFKDESDTDSSGADVEDDEVGGEDSGESVDEDHNGSPHRKSPAVPDLVGELEPHISDRPVPEIKRRRPSHISIPPVDIAQQPEIRSPMSLTDRLQIDLPSFETAAPIPSIPPTPNISASADTADELQKARSFASQLSESELSSGGGERSTIMKTLSGLWALRATEISALAYPL